jgi:hypothetical protein
VHPPTRHPLHSTIHRPPLPGPALTARDVAISQSKSALVSSRASAALSTLSQFGDTELQRIVASGSSEDELKQLIGALEEGGEAARRAAILLDGAALQTPESRIAIARLGAVPRLVGLVRGGPGEPATLSALGALEALAQANPEVQDEARVVGMLTALHPLLGERADHEIRCSATLALISLVAGNDASIRAARGGGLFEVLVEQLDAGPESELACLTVMGLKALGFRNQAEQEFAVRTLSSHAAAKSGEEEKTRVQRVGVLQAIWSMESMSSPATQRAGTGSR